jgi:Ca2+-binding RTX toxin-like protein
MQQVSIGTNPYVMALLNAGYRWDLLGPTNGSPGGNIIKWNIGATFNVPLDTKGIPPINTDPRWVTALQNATQDALAQWANVANIIPQFDATNPNIVVHVVPLASYNFGFGGYSGTPYEVATSTKPVLYKNLTVAENGQAHVYISDHATGGSDLPGDNVDHKELDQPVWSVDASGTPSMTDTGKELMIHEIGHALGLKHPHDYGASNSPYLFPGINAPADHAVADNNLNSKLYTIMSYNEADPPANLPFGGAPGGPAVTPMAFDIAAIQTLYGANTTTNSGDNTYTLSDPGSPDGQSWQCIWDTGGTDQIVYNGTANAVIDLRPATLDDSPTGGGMGSYTWNNTAVSRGGTIAGDIMNVLPDQGGVTGVVIENGIGGKGNDMITGNDANNLLEGNEGDDVISALAGNDIINGGPGNDTLTGGAGNDVFIFEPGSGHDTITDFTVGQDFLDVSELGVTLADFASQVKIAQIGNTTELQVGTFAGNSIIDLLNVNAAAISPTTDFKYV